MIRYLWNLILPALLGALLVPTVLAEPQNETAAASAFANAKKSKGDITAVNAGSGLTGGGVSGDVTLSVNFAGSGNATTAARSDHAHGLVNENTAVGVSALQNNTGAGNTAAGQQALENNTDGSSNTAVGNEALRANTSGTFNTALGAAALIENTTGGANSATGHNALQHNTTGSGNTATGAASLLLNTTGNFNTATGFEALEDNTQGQNNTASGVDALSTNTTGDNNTATGSGALQVNSTGNNNTASGAQALFNTTASANTAVGNQSLQNNTTGSGNIALGDHAGFNLTTGSNNIDIGNVGSAGESSTIRIGAAQNRTFIDGIRGTTTGIANAVPVVIDSAGQLGTLSSSRRFKNAIKPMDQSSEAILALKPVTFHYKGDAKATPQFGLIAEEVATVNPDLVVRNQDGEIYTVRYDAVNAMLLNEFLKQHRKIEKQGVTIAQQQKEIQTLMASLKEQAARIQKVSDELELTKPAPRTVLNDR